MEFLTGSLEAFHFVRLSFIGVYKPNMQNPMSPTTIQEHTEATHSPRRGDKVELIKSLGASLLQE